MAKRLPGLILLLLLSAAGLAQSIAYTVQVVAVSDQAQAFSLIRDLGLENFPAYATRATTAQGDVVRVRVGGFANRDAALLYAETMPDFPTPGSRPLPALADNIPATIMPYEPRLLLDTEAAEFSLLEWGDDAVAALFPEGEPEPGQYVLIREGNMVGFSAWQAWPDGSGLVLRFRDLPLWPENWAELTPGMLERELETQLDFLSDRLAVDADSLAAAVRMRAELPVVVVLERFNPWLSLEVGQLLGVTVPEGAGSDWQGELLGTADDAPSFSAEVLLQVSADLEPVSELETDDWTLQADGDFMLQSEPGVNRSWRAAVGAPLWTDGTFVLARHQGRTLLYDFPSRQ